MGTGKQGKAAEMKERKVGKRDMRKAAKRDRRKAAKRDKRKAAQSGKRKAVKRGRIKERKVKRCLGPGGKVIDMRDKMKVVKRSFGGGKMMGKMKEAKGSGGKMIMMMTKGKWRSWQILLGGSWKMTGGKMKMAWVGLWMFGERRMREVESWDKIVNE